MLRKHLPATATAATIVGGLMPGAEYAFTLRAANSVGAGNAAIAAATIPAVLPGAPIRFDGGGGWKAGRV